MRRHDDQLRAQLACLPHGHGRVDAVLPGLIAGRRHDAAVQAADRNGSVTQMPIGGLLDRPIVVGLVYLAGDLAEQFGAGQADRNGHL